MRKSAKNNRVRFCGYPQKWILQKRLEPLRNSTGTTRWMIYAKIGKKQPSTFLRISAETNIVKMTRTTEKFDWNNKMDDLCENRQKTTEYVFADIRRNEYCKNDSND
jgi:hypothetical protein